MGAADNKPGAENPLFSVMFAEDPEDLMIDSLFLQLAPVCCFLSQ